jgi:hypothetical protein
VRHSDLAGGNGGHGGSEPRSDQLSVVDVKWTAGLASGAYREHAGEYG